MSNMLFTCLMRTCRRLNVPKNLHKYHSICSADVAKNPLCASEFVVQRHLPVMQFERGYAKGKSIKKEKGNYIISSN